MVDLEESKFMERSHGPCKIWNSLLHPIKGEFLGVSPVRWWINVYNAFKGALFVTNARCRDEPRTSTILFCKKYTLDKMKFNVRYA